ncbi:5-formyltetrahydrofolate cyclo-ligase [Ruminiclostridium sufflavum DSM 19573]|uniref:5-formyltetrahydrofolate cyclo-ligase n=1 Tax=Ruminiclostridium sufflavum DSM 19573 TaxID=1121337 RepID=A0A318XN08_9FIRM|nr:5-formyltetrahydrofolate cyclo-ligase [Ruminiclostridium sufflavum]PYG88871.1 5-formyltetrahydrofolate cyclo-ligase [Ruminiclostridium sufflavum DSM 19573]
MILEVFEIQKKDVRRKYLSIRSKMEKNDVTERSSCIAEKLNRMEYIINAASIMCYVSFGNEVFTHELIKKWIREGKQVSVPCTVINNEQKYMHAVRIKAFDELKAEGNYGIPEPILRKCNIIRPDMLDIIIVPGSVFDIHKNRMGYGAGFYDSFLSGVSGRCQKIGLCFEFQLLDKIPFEEYDVPLDLLVTEKRIIV